MVTVASVCVSSLILTPSRACLASTAWCRPSDHCRPEHQAARELVDDDDAHVVGFGMAHHGIAFVLVVEVVRLEGVIDQVRPFHVAGRVEALDAGQLLGHADAFVGQVAGVLLLLDLEVDALALVVVLGRRLLSGFVRSLVPRAFFSSSVS